MIHIRCDQSQNLKKAIPEVQTILRLFTLLALASCLSRNITLAGDCLPAPAGLIGLWTGDQDGSDLVSGLTGSLVGGVINNIGKISSGFVFDGTGEVVIPDNPLLNSQQLSIEAWIYPTQSTGEVQIIINKESTYKFPLQYEVGIRGPQSEVGVIPVGNLAFYLDGISGLPSDYLGWVDGGKSIPLNQWTHFALSFDGSAVSIFVNGQRTRLIEGLSGSITQSGGPLKIGSRSQAVIVDFPGDRFAGTIDEVALYDRALSETEVRSVYLQSKCRSGFPPVIAQTPSNLTSIDGTNVTLIISTGGSAPLLYQWSKNGTNIIDATNSALVLSNVTIADAGEYHVMVSNEYGTNESTVANLTIHVIDHVAPLVEINSLQGLVEDQHFTLQGTATDNIRVATLLLQRDGGAPSQLELVTNSFTFSDVLLHRGTNEFRVTAIDDDGNQATAGATVIWYPERMLALIDTGPVQEGRRVDVPIELQNHGGVGGMSFTVDYDPNFLTDPQLEWSDELSSAFIDSNFSVAGRIRAAFALSGKALDGGSNQIARLSLRARSVPRDLSVVLRPAILSISDPNGANITSGNDVFAVTNAILKRSITGDINGNDRLDVGDANLILRLVTQTDFPRPWDILANDLNENHSLDSGDVIRVLRTVVGLDPAPGAKTAFRARMLAESTTPKIVLTQANGTLASGDILKVDLVVQKNVDSISGASFILAYPTNAIRLLDMKALRTGEIVPASSLTLWNVSPEQTNLLIQSGRIAGAFTSVSKWSTNNGMLAELEFQVQPGFTVQPAWPLLISNVEMSINGFDTVDLQNETLTLISRAPVPPKFIPDVTVSENAIQLEVETEIGMTYVLETSTDLLQWTELSRLSASTHSVRFNDSGSPSSNRFYRIRQEF